MKSLDFIFREAIPPQQTAPTARRVNVMNPQSYSVQTPQPAAAPIVNRDINKPDELGRIQQLAGTAPAEPPAGVVSSDGQPVRDGSGQQVQAGHTVPAGSPGAAQLPNAGLPPVKQPVDPNSVDSADAAAGQAAQAAVDQQNLANMDMQVGQGVNRNTAASGVQADDYTGLAQAQQDAANRMNPADTTSADTSGTGGQTQSSTAAVKPGETVSTWREPSGTSQTTATPPAAGTKPQAPAATTAPAAATAAGGYPGGISQADAEKKYGKTGAEIIRLGGMDAYNNRPKDAAGNLALLKQLQTGKAPAAAPAAGGQKTTAAPAAAPAAGGQKTTAAAPSQPTNPLYGTKDDPRRGYSYGQQPAPTATAAAPKATAQPNPASADATVPYDVARSTPVTPGERQMPGSQAAATAPAAKSATPANTAIKSTTQATLSGVNPYDHPNYQTYYQQELAKNNRSKTPTGEQMAEKAAVLRVQKELAQAKSGSQVSVNGAPPVQVGGGQAPASQTLKQGTQSKIASPFVMSNLNKNPNNFIVEYNKMTSVEKMQYLRSIITEAPKRPLSPQAQQWQAQRAQSPTSSVTTPSGATSTTMTGTGAPAAGTPPSTGSGTPPSTGTQKKDILTKSIDAYKSFAAANPKVIEYSKKMSAELVAIPARLALGTAQGVGKIARPAGYLGGLVLAGTAVAMFVANQWKTEFAFFTGIIDLAKRVASTTPGAVLEGGDLLRKIFASYGSETPKNQAPDPSGKQPPAPGKQSTLTQQAMMRHYRDLLTVAKYFETQDKWTELMTSKGPDADLLRANVKHVITCAAKALSIDWKQAFIDAGEKLGQNPLAVPAYVLDQQVASQITCEYETDGAAAGGVKFINKLPSAQPDAQVKQ